MRKCCFNLHWWCFSFHQLVQTLYLHSGWLLSATCTGGLVHRSTGAYTACADCNLHCVVVVVLVVLVVYIYSTNTLPALGVVTLVNLHWWSWYTYIYTNRGRQRITIVSPFSSAIIGTLGTHEVFAGVWHDVHLYNAIGPYSQALWM